MSQMVPAVLRVCHTKFYENEQALIFGKLLFEVNPHEHLFCDNIGFNHAEV